MYYVFGLVSDGLATCIGTVRASSTIIRDLTDG